MPSPLHSPRRTCGALTLALALGVGAFAPIQSAGAASADGSAEQATRAAQAVQRAEERATRGRDPFPGYTISNPPLEPLTVRGKKTRVLQGVRKHAGYIIEKPQRWNGELMMWAHGYRGTGTELTVDAPSYDLRALALKQGYAWAASSYARNDYDIETGVTTTHDLAKYAGRRLGTKPSRVYVAGVSMGGHIIGRSLEDFPEFYDGAMPMCGVLGDQELFDYFLSYNLVAQDLADRPAYPPQPDYLTTDVPYISQQLGLVGLNPGGPDTTTVAGKQLRAITTNLTGGRRPGSQNAFAYWKSFPFTLFTPDNAGSLAQNAGRLAQNIDTTYRPNAPADVNSSVQRVAPRDAFSRQTSRLTQVPKIAGRPRVPVLTLHGLGDLFVPFSMEQIYAKDARSQRQGRFVVQRAIRSVGHCEFTPAEAASAWNDLTRWVEKSDGRRPGKGRPAGDRISRPRVVASADFGCRFTDPAGSASALTPTHALYPTCTG